MTEQKLPSYSKIANSSSSIAIETDVQSPSNHTDADLQLSSSTHFYLWPLEILNWLK